MRVYLVAPANFYTGGPTAIFQLCHWLNKWFGIPAMIAFTNVRKDVDPVHPNYKKYKCRWIAFSSINDSARNLIIVPENSVKLLDRFRKARKAIYWLAVDNFFLSKYFQQTIRSRFTFYRYSLIYCLKWRCLPSRQITNDVMHYVACKEASNALEDVKLRELLNKIDLHIAQSLYSKNFLGRLGIGREKIFMLREPLEEEFINTYTDLDAKEDIIAFNVRKSFSIVYKILSEVKMHFGNVKIVPLVDVGKERMIRILSKSKIFIDIGLHPGRDRPPREAGVLGNIVIVNKSGGCYYFEDCPIPDRYAIPCREIACRGIDPHQVADLVADSLEHYDQNIKKFQHFRENILREPDIYKRDIEYLLNNCNF